MTQGIKESEGIHLWFKVVIEQGLERTHFGVHYHDVGCNAGLSQCDTFIGHCHGEIIHAVVLQGLGYLCRTGTISVSLYHADKLCLGLHERAVVVQVFHDGVEIYLQYRLMHLLHEAVSDAVKAEGTCSLDEYHLVVKACERLAFQESLRVIEEMLFLYLHHVGAGRQRMTDADKLFHSP